MNFKPVNERIMIKLCRSEEKSEGGIIIPTTIQEKYMEAEVIEVSDKCKLDINKGSKILYDYYAGVVVKKNDEEFIIIREMDVIGIFN